MKTEKYTYLLAHPQTISGDDLMEIGEIIQKYPYFQSARALQLKGLKNQNSFLYNDALKVTAAYTSERDMLFEYITSENFIQNEISQLIQHHSDAIKDINIDVEDISAQVSVENENLHKDELKKADAILNPQLFERKISRIDENLNAEAEVSLEDKKHSEADMAAEDIHVNQPLPFTKTDTHSFTEWLQLTKTKPIDRGNTEENKTDLNSTNQSTEVIDANIGFTAENEARPASRISEKLDLIDRFIQERPKIIPKDTSIPENKNLAAPFTQTSDSLMTETLAKVYLQQNNYKKAIQAYKILILKNPEKSGFFADQIRAIEKLTNTK